MDEDSKVVLLKIMHTAIIVHSPEPIFVENVPNAENGVNGAPNSNDNLFKKNVAENVQLWHKHLRNMFGVVEREIKESRKRPNRLNPTPVICRTLVQMAAKLCSVVGIHLIFCGILSISHWNLAIYCPVYVFSRYFGTKVYGTVAVTSSNRKNVAKQCIWNE